MAIKTFAILGLVFSTAAAHGASVQKMTQLDGKSSADVKWDAKKQAQRLHTVNTVFENTDTMVVQQVTDRVLSRFLVNPEIDERAETSTDVTVWKLGRSGSTMESLWRKKLPYPKGDLFTEYASTFLQMERSGDAECLGDDFFDLETGTFAFTSKVDPKSYISYDDMGVQAPIHRIVGVDVYSDCLQEKVAKNMQVLRVTYASSKGPIMAVTLTGPMDEASPFADSQPDLTLRGTDAKKWADTDVPSPFSIEIAFHYKGKDAKVVIPVDRDAMKVEKATVPANYKLARTALPKENEVLPQIIIER